MKIRHFLWSLLGLLDYVGSWVFTKAFDFMDWEGVVSKGLILFDVMNSCT